MTDKEIRAIAIKEVTYADMIAIGATEEIATVASWKARYAFEASWDCAVDKIFKCIEDQAIFGWIEDIEVDKFLDKIRRAMEE